MESQIQFWQETLALAKSIASRFPRESAPVSDCRSSPLAIESIPLKPPSISNDLIAYGVPKTLLTLLNPAISQLTLLYESSLRDHVLHVLSFEFPAGFEGLDLSTVFIKQACALFEETYRRFILPELCQTVFSRLETVAITSTSASIREVSDCDDTAKPQFHDAFRPFLEKYFEYNAYPSRADQEFLARKTEMTRRQIEVFFQNRRRRWREAGKELPQRHPSDPLPADLDIERWAKEKATLQTSVVTEERGAREHVPNQDLDVLARWINPTSAFPAILPADGLIPWFQRTREPLPNPEWTRKPGSQSVRPNQSQTTMKELKQIFLRCLQWPTSSKKSRQPKSYLDTAREPAVRAITVVPPPAPLPALVPSHSPLLKQPQKPKKTSGLPKRRPKHPPVGHKAGQSVTPSSSHTFPFPASPIVGFSSRTSSLESDCSYITASSSSTLQRKTSHSSLRSNRSSSSDGTPPSTPPDSSIALPGSASCVVLPTQFSIPRKPPTRQATPAISVAGTDDHFSLFGDSDPLQELFEGTATTSDPITCNPSDFGQLPSIDTGLGDLNALFADIENPLNFFSNWDLMAPVPSNAEFSYAF